MNTFLKNVPKDVELVLIQQEHNLNKSIEIEKIRNKITKKIKKFKNQDQKVLLTQNDDKWQIEKEKDRTEDGLNKKYGKHAW